MARVSIKTVSRVLNEEGNVRPATASRVKEAIAELDYEPNDLARNLKRRSSHTVALLIADISNPFYAEVAKAVETYARQQGYVLILAASDEDPDIERQYIRLLTRRQIEGLVVVPTSDEHTYLEHGRLAKLPVVAVDRPISDLSVDTVLAENREGAKKAVEHLIEHGHTRIAYVGAQASLYTTQTRLQGYRDALEDGGLQPMVRLEAPDAGTAMAAIRDLLRASVPPTAVFAMNNLVTLGVLQALRRADLRVPEDVAVVGFDDFPLADVLHPRLTLVRQSAFNLGWRAAELLFDRLKTGGPRGNCRLTLETELAVRESCGCIEHPTAQDVGDAVAQGLRPQ